MTAIVGRRRQGKSTLAYALSLAASETVIVFDPNSQYNNVQAIATDELDAWLRANQNGAAARIVPADGIEDSFTALMDVLDGGTWAWGDYSLVIDECSTLMSPHSIHPAIERLVRTGPSDVNVVMTTHRMVDINPLVRNLAHDWFIFQQFLERELKAVSEQFGPDVAAAAQTLPTYHIIHWWLERGGAPAWEVWSKPSDWYVDIGRIH